MLSTIKTLALPVILSILVIDTQLIYAVDNVLKICQTPKNTLVVKKKCGKKQRGINLQYLAERFAGSSDFKVLSGSPGPVGKTGFEGPKGPSGKIDFSGCRQIIDEQNNYGDVGLLYRKISCDQNHEFIIADQYWTSAAAGVRVFIQGKDSSYHTIAGDTRPWEIYVYALRMENSGAFTLNVSALCCPR